MQLAPMNTLSLRELSVLDNCATALAKAERLDELTDIRSRAEAIRIWAKSANQSLEVQNRAAALRLDAERKAGKLLLQLHLRGGNRKSKAHAAPLKLEDLGITRDQSTRWQKQAEIPDDQFEKYVSGLTLIGKEITAAGLLRLVANAKGKSTANGRTRPRKANARIRRTFADSDLQSVGDENAVADLHEAINHVNLLLQVLTPYANDEAEYLSKSEKRVVISLLGEVESILKKVCGK